MSAHPAAGHGPADPPRRAALLDRDGVINVDHGYVHAWEDFEFLPGAIDAMAQLHRAGYLLVVVTNQSGIARGYYGPAEFDALSTRMSEHLAAHGAPLTAIFHCPHLPDAPVAEYARDCSCRKPKPGMILDAAAMHRLSLAESFLAGDKPSDIEAARAAGVGRAYLIDPAQAGEATHDAGARAAAQRSRSGQPDACLADLAACVRHVLAGAPR